MIKNKIECISQQFAVDLISNSKKNKDEYLVTLHMKYIHTWEQFAEALGNAFQLPMRNEGMDGTKDWMEDLELLDKYAYKLVLFDFYELDNQALKELLLKFLTYIIQWWEKDVVQYCVGGEPKSFEVYLVE